MEFKLGYMGRTLYGDARAIGLGRPIMLKRQVTMTNAKQGTEFTFQDIKLENALWDAETHRSDVNFRKIDIKSDDGSITLSLDS